MQTGRPAARNGRARSTDPRKLVGLHADQADQRSAALLADQVDDAFGPNPAVGLVICVQANFDIRSQHLTAAGVFSERVETSKRIGGNCGADPLDRIAVVIIVRWLDQHEMK